MSSSGLPQNDRDPAWDAMSHAPMRAATPVDEELPPELPAAPHVSDEAALEKLREFFGAVKGAPGTGGVLAMLVPPQTLKAGLTSRPALAQLCGYESGLEFFEESQQLPGPTTTPWFVTSDKNHGGWVIWCEHDLPPARGSET